MEQPCPDVYRFPLFTDAGADAIVDIMEDHGKWSNGKNEVSMLLMSLTFRRNNRLFWRSSEIGLSKQLTNRASFEAT